MTPIKGKDDLMPAQEKLEWVTPKISLMDAGDTEGKNNRSQNEGLLPPAIQTVGPS